MDVRPVCAHCVDECGLVAVWLATGLEGDEGDPASIRREHGVTDHRSRSSCWCEVRHVRSVRPHDADLSNRTKARRDTADEHNQAAVGGEARVAVPSKLAANMRKLADMRAVGAHDVDAV